MFCTRARDRARADDAKIVRSRNAQCKTRESPYIASAQKFCNCLFLLRIEVLIPKRRSYARTALSLVALARDFLLPSSANARSLAMKLFKFSRRANKLTREPIRTTTRFSGTAFTGQHHRPVPSDVSLSRLGERRRRLKFRLLKPRPPGHSGEFNIYPVLKDGLFPRPRGQ